MVVGAGEHGPPAADVAVDLHHRRPAMSPVAPIWGRELVSTTLRSVEALRPFARRLAILDLLAQGGGRGYGGLSRLCRLGCCLCCLRGRCFCGGKTSLPCLVFNGASTGARSGDVLALRCGGGALAGGGHGCSGGGGRGQVSNLGSRSQLITRNHLNHAAEPQEGSLALRRLD